MGFELESIAKEIESLKESLNNAAVQNRFDLTDHALLQLSQKLDELIMEYYRLLKNEVPLSSPPTWTRDD
ncbi:aspartyl-phosphate phosphatase Spo0E family protein [Paenibacillus cremeus]|uniref:Aspartyl-phosphate phosphatase Spo0E family protein n=1 Tax=Paenibacillus cremeus TaxID=2163881 RepID=A0A559K4U3_9BACL|nr:aspartyl-phosphate phosphatase Spo0E family protein [Paenibacillus cremeus]TVY07162.1 aspartyl-phosphate phosphatase Spo0E family protein [Paenibacillus cremeus]